MTAPARSAKSSKTTNARSSSPTTISIESLNGDASLPYVSREVPDSLRSRQLVEIRSALPPSIVFSCRNEVTKRRIVYAPETGLLRRPLSRKNKTCQICGKPTPNKGRGMCLGCYQKLRAVRVVLRCSLCGTLFGRHLYDYQKSLRRGYVDFYCSPTCSKNHHAVKNARRCEQCGTPMPGRRGRRFCGKECTAAYRIARKTTRQCPECSTAFYPKFAHQQYCSRPCADAAHSKRMIGAGNSHFKDGTSYAKWFDQMRPIILERDKGACIVCGATEFTRTTKAKDQGGQSIGRTNLLIHHINGQTSDNRPENLITICHHCHATHHKSESTPWPWFATYAEKQSPSMTSRLKEQIIILQRIFSSTTAC